MSKAIAAVGEEHTPAAVHAASINATLAMQRNDFSAARKHLVWAHGVARSLGHRRRVGATLANLGDCYLFSGDDLDQAFSCYGRSAAILISIDRRIAGRATLNQGVATLEMGDAQEAKRLIRDAITILDQAHALDSLGSAHAYLGFAEFESGNAQEAAEHLEQATRFAGAVQDKVLGPFFEMWRSFMEQEPLDLQRAAVDTAASSVAGLLSESQAVEILKAHLNGEALPTYTLVREDGRLAMRLVARA